MELQIKTFRIHSEADEQALNAFLHNKIVRHWSTTFIPDTSGALGAISSALTGSSSDQTSAGGSWNVFIAYEIRVNDPRTGAQSSSRTGAKSKNGEARGDGRGDSRGDGRGDARGAAAKREPKAKDPAPSESYVPNVAADDMPLFEAVRKWRNARARDEGVKPFKFFNNHGLEEIVKAKPTTQTDLRNLLPEMEPELFEKYHNELLGFLGAAASSGTTSGAGASVEPTSKAAAA